MIAWQECPACGGVFAAWDADYSTDKPPDYPPMTSRLFVNREAKHHIAPSSSIGATRCLDCGIASSAANERYGTNVVTDRAQWRCDVTLPPPPIRTE